MTLFDFAKFDGQKTASRTFRKGSGIRSLLLILGASVAGLVKVHAVAAEALPPALKRPIAHFSQDAVIQEAKALASEPYVAPPPRDHDPAKELAGTYDEYRMARFRPEAAIQLDKVGKYRLQLLPTAWIHNEEVELALVDNGVSTPVRADPDMFDWGTLKKVAAFSKGVPLSGFRINGPLNSPDVSDEIIVFQGASYFRALSRGQVYGISARGLALRTGAIGGEEFPRFTKFWIERPEPHANKLVVHALLESRSVAGAYLFKIDPGDTTAIDIEATLFPRTEISQIGLAPLTSMYLVSSSDRTRVSDFRPSVHDSDGLTIHNGSGEYLWRPLSNPRQIEVSMFQDDGPKGFGLEQRERKFAAYQDLEAKYHLRPSVWVEPKSDWGRGSVVLVELPTETEANDNIVAFWRPDDALAPGKAYRLAYRLSWPDTFRDIGPKVRIMRTMAGLSIGSDRSEGAVQFVIEYDGIEGESDRVEILPTMQTSEGRLSKPQVQVNRESGTLRVAFKFYPGASETAELRVALSALQGGSETWLYRWTKGMHQ